MFETLNSETKEASDPERMGLYERNKLQATIIDALGEDHDWLLKNEKENGVKISDFLDGKTLESTPELQEAHDRVWELTNESLVEKAEEDSPEKEEARQKEIEGRFREAAVLTIKSLIELEPIASDIEKVLEQTILKYVGFFNREERTGLNAEGWISKHREKIVDFIDGKNNDLLDASLRVRKMLGNKKFRPAAMLITETLSLNLEISPDTLKEAAA